MSFNSSAKTDRGRMLGGWNGEWNIFNTGMPFAANQQKEGGSTTDTGMKTLTESKDFWQNILSGNKTATATAAAPAINAMNAQADAARNQAAEMGTARGGGVAGANQQAETQRMAAGTDAVFAARPVAAQQLGQIGQAEIDLGQNQLRTALAAMGLSQSAIQHIIDSSSKSRTDSFSMNPLNALPSVFLDKALAAFGL